LTIYNYERKYLTLRVKYLKCFSTKAILHLNEISLFPFKNEVCSQKLKQKNSDFGSFADTACRPKCNCNLLGEKEGEKM